MSITQEKIKEIEEIKAFLVEHNDKTKSLQQEIDSATQEIQSKQLEYKELVITGDDSKADKLFIEINNLKNSMSAKENRLATMKQSTRELVLTRWNDIKKISSTLADLYRQEHDDLVNDYIKAKLETEKIKKKIEHVGSELNSYQYSLSIMCDEMFKDNDITNIPMIFPQGSLFYDGYLKAKEEQYLQNI